MTKALLGPSLLESVTKDLMRVMWYQNSSLSSLTICLSLWLVKAAHAEYVSGSYPY